MSLLDALGPHLRTHRRQWWRFIPGAAIGGVWASLPLFWLMDHRSADIVGGIVSLAIGALGVWILRSMQLKARTQQVHVHQRGVSVAGQVMLWDDVERVELRRRVLVLTGGGRELSVPTGLTEMDALVQAVRVAISARAELPPSPDR